MKVTKQYVFEPSDLDPPGQDQYEYWIYDFTLEDRHYGVRRYTDTPDHATILDRIRNADEQALADASAIERYLVASEGVETVYRYDTKTGVFGRVVEP
jgi:hypothetical protein